MKEFLTCQRMLSCLLLGFLFVGLVGCTRGLTPEYGNSKGTSGNKGINGFGTLRKSFAANGWKVRDVNRLSDRLDSLDAMVWIPTTYQAYESPAVMWMHDWLGDKPRTLIYIIPDEGNEVRYWETARDLAPPKQRLEYRRRHAKSISDLLNGVYGHGNNSVNEIDRFWFKARMRADPRPRWEILPHWSTLATTSTAPVSPQYTSPYFNSTTDWASEGYVLADDELTIQPLLSESTALPLAVRIYTTQNNNSDASQASDSVPAQEVDIFQPDVSANTNPDASTDATAEVESEWDEDWDDEDWADAQDSMEPSEWERYQRRRRGGYGIGDSEIIVVAGGSLITNFGIVTDEGRELVEHLIIEAGKRADPTKPRIGFITSGFGGVPVSESGDRPQMASGMELLSVWPLSIITVHLALMGIIACLILLPIFGRPRKLKERSNSDFADHINAVGSLLNRSGGELYARQRISEYFRKIRGETAGPWVMPLPHIVTPPPKPITEPNRNAVPRDAAPSVVTNSDPAAVTTASESVTTFGDNIIDLPPSIDQPTLQPRKDSNES